MQPAVQPAISRTRLTRAGHPDASPVRAVTCRPNWRRGLGQSQFSNRTVAVIGQKANMLASDVMFSAPSH